MKTLDAYLDAYLKLRRQLGFKLAGRGSLLRNFVRFARRKRAGFITTQLALEWATEPPHIQPMRKANRLGVVRCFAQYLSAIDPRTEVPAYKLLPRQVHRRNPYLLGAQEVLRLVQSTRQIDPAHPIKGAAYATLIGLLAVSGMRVGEAIGLDRDEVDLTQGLVTVRQGKGNKSRLVPLHPSTEQALQRYATLRDQTFRHPGCANFFVSERGTPLRYWTVNRWFLLVAYQLGWRQPHDRRGPRLHDLRHRFAIQTMLGWYRSHADVEAHLPELSTYLGHARLEDTYWYLSAVPELLQLATRRCQRQGAGR